MVNEAFKVLNDPAQRAEYDRDIKKYGLKDGQGLRTDKNFQRQSSATRREQTAARNSEPSNKTSSAKPDPSVEIPDNIEALSVKQIKNLLDSLGIKRDDCFEKDDLIVRLKEAKAGRGKPAGSGANSRPPRSKTEATRQPSGATGQDFHFDSSKYEMPKPATVFFKIISVGNSESGKSCLIKRYCEGRFVKRYISTIGIDYGVKKLDILGQKVCINFFDLSGNDDYKMIRTEFYKDASGVIMVFDVDNRDSYTSLIHWEEEMKRYGADMNRVKVVVCANKCESKSREVKEAEASRWAKQRGFEYFETSASDGKNVTESFESMFTNCVK